MEALLAPDGATSAKPSLLARSPEGHSQGASTGAPGTCFHRGKHQPALGTARREGSLPECGPRWPAAITLHEAGRVWAAGGLREGPWGGRRGGRRLWGLRARGLRLAGPWVLSPRRWPRSHRAAWRQGQDASPALPTGLLRLSRPLSPRRQNGDVLTLLRGVSGFGKVCRGVSVGCMGPSPHAAGAGLCLWSERPPAAPRLLAASARRCPWTGGFCAEGQAFAPRCPVRVRIESR